jgi:hypothetical protein
MVERTGDSLPPSTVEFMFKHMPPELVAPVAAYLVSADCRITGEVLNAAGGAVSRMVMVNSPGIRDQDLTPEVVADRLEEILDIASGAPATLMLPEEAQ